MSIQPGVAAESRKAKRDGGLGRRMLERGRAGYSDMRGKMGKMGVGDVNCVERRETDTEVGWRREE